MSLQLIALCAFLCLTGLNESLASTTKLSLGKGSISVMSPTGLSLGGAMGLAEFGKPQYGAVLMGELVYPSSDPQFSSQPPSCGQIGCQFGCLPPNDSNPPYRITRVPGKHYVMMLDRGPFTPGMGRCFFLEKAYHAQLAGADAVIIVNNEPNQDVLTAGIPTGNETVAQLLPRLEISAGMISMEDGAVLKAAMKEGPVVVALNWTNILQERAKVDMDFWSTVLDDCGAVCDQQRTFIKSTSPALAALQQQGQLTFRPHYYMNRCPSTNSSLCRNQCIMGGLYCAMDPEGNVVTGITGREALLMNLKSLCFFYLADADAQPWLWWDYIQQVDENCNKATNTYNDQCAEQAFIAVGGSELASGQGLGMWRMCSTIPMADQNMSQPGFPQGGTHPLAIQVLEEEIEMQNSFKQQQDLARFHPGMFINGHWYLGTLDRVSVLRATCSSYQEASRPPLCQATDLEVNECEVHANGWKPCSDQASVDRGLTRCVNQYKGYQCECQLGFTKVEDHSQPGTAKCVDVNECAIPALIASDPQCSCERCVCINEVGSYRCTGPIQNVCVQQNNYGGCWKGEQVQGRTLHACLDNFQQFKAIASQGVFAANASLAVATGSSHTLQTSTGLVSTFKCECPPCYRKSEKGGGCVPACELADCHQTTGMCASTAKSSSSSGELSSVSSSSSGEQDSELPIVAVVFIVLGSVVLSSLITFLGYRVLVRVQIRRDMQRILDDHIPLNTAPSSHSIGPSQFAPKPLDGLRNTRSITNDSALSPTPSIEEHPTSKF